MQLVKVCQKVVHNFSALLPAACSSYSQTLKALDSPGEKILQSRDALTATFLKAGWLGKGSWRCVYLPMLQNEGMEPRVGGKDGEIR